MELDQISQKRINELEQMTTQLVRTMKATKLNSLPLFGALQEFEQALENERRARYDDSHPAYRGY